jgi:hypothetical protein
MNLLTAGLPRWWFFVKVATMTKLIVRQGDRIFVFAILLVLVFGCTQVAAALIQTPASIQERLTALETWRSQHQLDDNKQFIDIEALTKLQAAETLAASTRLTTLEVQFVNVESEISSMIRILIAVAGAAGLQLCHLVWIVLKKKPVILIDKIEPSTARRRHGD